MTKEELVKVEKALNDFGKLLGTCMEGCAKIYVNITREIPAARRMFRARYPMIRGAEWKVLELIGSGRLAAKEFLREFPVGSSLQKVRLFGNLESDEEREAMLKVGIPVHCPVDNTHRMGKLKEMTDLEVSMVIDPKENRLRSLEEQATWYRKYKERMQERANKRQHTSDDYEISKVRGHKEVVFLTKHSWTVGELERLIEEMR